MLAAAEAAYTNLTSQIATVLNVWRFAT